MDFLWTGGTFRSSGRIVPPNLYCSEALYPSPQARVIDMMLLDDKGVYFLTAKGKAFYAQLMEQGYIALSAAKGKVSISLRGKIRNIGKEKLDEIFDKNTYMQSIYPGDTRDALASSPLLVIAGHTPCRRASR